MSNIVIFILIDKCMCYRLSDTERTNIASDKATLEDNNFNTDGIDNSVKNNISLKHKMTNNTGVNLTSGSANGIMSSQMDIAFLTAGNVDKQNAKTNSTNSMSFAKYDQNNEINFKRASDTTAILIVGPAAAVGIFLFLCIAFYFHNMQLNNRYKQLTITMYVSPCADDDKDNNNVQLKTCPPQLARTRSVSPAPGMLVPVEGDLKSHRRKSLAPPQGLAPSGPGKAKRSTSVSPGIDKELLTVSAAKRKQSVFIL